MKTYDSLEKVEPLKEEIAKIDYAAIRKIFLSPPANAGVKPVWKQFDKDAVEAFLVGEHSFSAERVDAASKRILKVENSRSDTLEKWFG
jgi:flap endonuclease-1